MIGYEATYEWTDALAGVGPDKTVQRITLRVVDTGDQGPALVCGYAGTRDGLAHLGTLPLQLPARVVAWLAARLPEAHAAMLAAAPPGETEEGER